MNHTQPNTHEPRREREEKKEKEKGACKGGENKERIQGGGDAAMRGYLHTSKPPHKT